MTNPTDKDLRGYWWTCVAVDSHPTTRIFAPADRVAQTTRDPMRESPWPYFSGSIENSTFAGIDGVWPVDNSLLGNVLWGDFFLRIPDSAYTPFVAHTQTDGFVLVHGHPLNGTKFFTWGQNGPGRFMQDFLSGVSGSDITGPEYTELQVGPAPTQMQTFPMPKHSSLQWTEWFRGFQAESVEVMYDADYAKPMDVIDKWIRSDSGMPTEHFNDIDTFFKKYTTAMPSVKIAAGMPWGGLESLRMGLKAPQVQGLPFDLPSPGEAWYDEAAPGWSSSPWAPLATRRSTPCPLRS